VLFIRFYSLFIKFLKEEGSNSIYHSNWNEKEN
jgi:hypothetical protein